MDRSERFFLRRLREARTPMRYAQWLEVWRRWRARKARYAIP